MRLLPRTAIIMILFTATTIMAFTRRPQRVIFFGDSITAQGARPGGYITRMKDALVQKGLANDYELIGAGIGGNKVTDLYLRMDDDVLAQNPDVVFIYIGVNDVWHKAMFGTGTDIDKFEKFYTAIINKLLDRHIRVILCTPAVIGEKTDFTNQQDGDLNAYSQVIRNLAQKFHCGLVDLRETFHTYELRNNPGNKDSSVLTHDRVHLNDNGNQLVADKMLEALLAK
ncbi:SGNH/GDSL hydrolase family protein [Puia dinghuensis]|uniref:Lysophospholipase n=1 Tax=Puia dinghuensis TaxID=1792502 RepID=A0A8J2XV00_9BACT|nr:SGNH/GDSL hydrolase family protein [Puia dinghuensis]GGB13128.1 lysophospholipase [Puia dinghuensis]